MVLIFLLNIVTYKNTLEIISNLMEEIWWLIRGLSVLGSQIFLSNYRQPDLYIVGLLQVIQLWISDYAFISTQYKTILNSIYKSFFTGLGISLVRNGSVLNKGYGHARLDPPVAFDENTVSNIGSTSKAFTAALLGVLITESKQRGTR